MVFWNDKNKDGLVQRDECVILDHGFSITNGWGGRIAPDLTLYTDGIAKIKPDHIDPDGSAELLLKWANHYPSR